MIFTLIALILLSLSFLIWNILNETAVLNFFNTKDLKYLIEWHLYDAVLRSILIPAIILYPLGVTWISIRICISVGLFYHYGFNTLINYWRKRKEWKTFNNKERIQILLYLSPGSKIDNATINFSIWLSEKISKIRKKKVTIDYRNINFIIILIEITITILLWL